METRRRTIGVDWSGRVVSFARVDCRGVGLGRIARKGRIGHKSRRRRDVNSGSSQSWNAVGHGVEIFGAVGVQSFDRFVGDGFSKTDQSRIGDRSNQIVRLFAARLTNDRENAEELTIGRTAKFLNICGVGYPLTTQSDASR